MAIAAYLETHGIARSHWEPSDMPRPISNSTSLDPALIKGTHPFQHIRYLGSLITHAGHDDLAYFMIKLGHLPGNELPPPRGEWRRWVNQIDGRGAELLPSVGSDTSELGLGFCIKPPKKSSILAVVRRCFTHQEGKEPKFEVSTEKQTGVEDEHQPLLPTYHLQKKGASSTRRLPIRSSS